MPLHIINKVSKLLPETGALVKQASLEKNLPTDTREETLLSALELEYMMKVAHTNVDIDDATRVCRAVDLYGLRDEVRDKSSTMIKAASASKSIERSVREAEDFIDTQLMSSNPNFEKIAKVCEDLWDNYSDHITNEAVKIYSGAGRLVKEAAVSALLHRAKVTGNNEFEKVAEVISSTNISNLSVDDNRAIINAVSGLEKSAQYSHTNLYTDMFTTKKANCFINLCGKRVDPCKIIPLADQVGSVLGSDIGSLLKDPETNSAAIEALPLGEKQVILGLIGG